MISSLLFASTFDRSTLTSWVAAIYSVIETCKLNDIESQAYITDVIEKIASDWPASRWDELMPWNWLPAQPETEVQAA